MRMSNASAFNSLDFELKHSSKMEVSFTFFGYSTNKEFFIFGTHKNGKKVFTLFKMRLRWILSLIKYAAEKNAKHPNNCQFYDKVCDKKIFVKRERKKKPTHTPIE